MTFPKVRYVALMLLLGLSVSGTTGAQTASRPIIEPEPVSVFADAYLKAKKLGLDARHSDEKQYRAFHYTSSSGPAVVIAQSVTVDDVGHVHITLEPGTSARGRAMAGGGEVHILLPASAKPPQ